MGRGLTVLVLACGLAWPVAAETAWPVHGNWCGPWHGGGPPRDALDAACMRHDQCYRRTRSNDCGCDLALMDEVRRLTWPSAALYRKGRAVYELFGLLPCFGTGAQRATKWQWMQNDRQGAVARGRETPDAMVGRLLGLIGTGLANSYPK